MLRSNKRPLVEEPDHVCKRIVPEVDCLICYDLIQPDERAVDSPYCIGTSGRMHVHCLSRFVMESWKCVCGKPISVIPEWIKEAVPAEEAIETNNNESDTDDASNITSALSRDSVNIISSGPEPSSNFSAHWRALYRDHFFRYYAISQLQQYHDTVHPLQSVSNSASFSSPPSTTYYPFFSTRRFYGYELFDESNSIEL